MKKSALVHLGTDQVHIYSDSDTVSLERNSLEQTLPSVLHTLHDSQIRDVRVVQGPWSFLNIRVGSLLLNTRQSLAGGELAFHTIQKDELYQRLYDQWYTPRYTAMFIGQKKNARRYDHTEQSYETLRFAQIAEKSEDCLIDQTTHEYLTGKSLSFIRKNEPQVVRNEKEISLADAPRQDGESTIPYYGIQPLTN